MKTERITILGTPDFKAFLANEAKREGVSVGELVRKRCEGSPTADEELLQHLSAQLQASVREAQHALGEGLAAANAVLAELGHARDQPKRSKAAA
jgi:hypothetical protein